MYILLIALLLLGLFAALLGWITHLRGGSNVPVEPEGDCSTCTGENDRCEQTCMMEAATREIEYFDDEELDRFSGRDAEEYTDEEQQEFSDVLYTMRPVEVKDWLRSLTLRGIALPNALKDEAFAIIDDAKRSMAPLLIIGALLLLASCSTKKNTAQTRWWHSFNTRYNTYYNGAMAYVDASLEKEKGNRDNFTEIIPLYTVGNKTSRELGKSNYDRAIEKAQKAIHQHSIRRRPVWDKNRRKTARDIEWLNRREYNPFLWKAWLLMGRSQFHEGNFEEAASTFSYMSRIYRTQPAIYGKARAWLAKAYVEQDLLYDAEDVIRNMQRDSIHWRAKKEWDYTLADYYIRSGKYEEAIPYLRQVIRHEMRTKQRAREWFLLGQLYQALGNNQKAYKAYRSVLRQNPPYELQFNARIAMSEVSAAGKAKQMIARLRRMARNDNNKEYLDQVYYAMGNIYLSDGDTLGAIRAYETGNEKATRSGIEKGVLLLRLGDLYWQTEQFSHAHRCYSEAIGLLDKDRKDYQQLSDRSLLLDVLVPHTDAVHLQDSLQTLAKMPEAERNKVIDRLIQEYKRKQKAERRNQAEQNRQANSTGLEDINTPRSQAPQTPAVNTPGSTVWYFYNPQALQQGKLTFEKLWGKRENVDNWRRSNKTVVASEMAEDTLTETQRDSIAAEEAQRDSLEQQADSVQNNPLRREYYLQQIPFTEEQLAQSNLLLQDGLFNAGVIFKDKLGNLSLSEKYLTRLQRDFPTYENMDQVWYHLYLLYSRKHDPDRANHALQTLIAEYPESELTQLVTDPYYFENARFGVHIEDSLYQATYHAFKEERYAEARGNLTVSAQRFPDGAHRDKFIFVDGMMALNEGYPDTCVVRMEEVVKRYPQSELAEMAGMIVNGVKAGRRLRGGRFDIGNVWQRRTEVLNTNDSTEVKTFVNDRQTPFLFLYAYEPDSIEENQLLFELARYNFTSYLVRSFDIEIDGDGSLHRMKVGGFRSYDEALQYARNLSQQKRLATLAAKARPIIISEKNFALLGTAFSYDDYSDYYQQHFAPLQVSTIRLLMEPAEPAAEGEDQSAVETDSDLPTVEEIDQLLDDNDFIDNGLDIELPAEPSVVTPASSLEVPVEETAAPVENTTLEVPVEEAPAPVENNTLEIPIEETATPVESTTLEIPIEEEPTPQNQPQSPVEDIIEITPAPTEAPSKQNPPQTTNTEYDLEDEYYDLDGF